MFENYKVYVVDYDKIGDEIVDNLKEMFEDKLIFGVPNEEVFWIDL
jgi:hypothetical protein